MELLVEERREELEELADLVHCERDGALVSQGRISCQRETIHNRVQAGPLRRSLSVHRCTGSKGEWHLFLPHRVLTTSVSHLRVLQVKNLTTVSKGGHELLVNGF